MGMDIHVHIVDKDGKYIAKEIWDGRNHEWFTKIDREEDEWNHVNWIYDYDKEFVPADIKKVFHSDEYSGYFGFKAVKVADFVEWYQTYKPQLTAGWMRKYDAWAMVHKHETPDYVSKYWDADEMDPNDWVFVENIPTADEYAKDIIDTFTTYRHELRDDSRWNGDWVEAYVIFYFDW